MFPNSTRSIGMVCALSLFVVLTGMQGASPQVAPQGKTVNELLTESLALFKDSRFREALQRVEEALGREPTNGDALFSKGMILLNLGRYEESLPFLERAQTLGVPDAALHIAVLKAGLRQIQGNGLPPPEWKPNYKSYRNMMVDFRPPVPLAYFMSGAAAEPATPRPGAGLSLTGTLGESGTKLEFLGTEESPIRFAPNYWVWQGAWINDPEYGLLLENGTSFRRVEILGDERVITTGRIVDWRHQILVTTKERVAQK